MQGLPVSLEDRRIPTWIAGASCTGSETALLDCPGAEFRENVEACGLVDVLHVQCFGGPDPGAKENG